MKAHTASTTNAQRSLATLKPGTIAHHAHHFGLDRGEPLVICPQLMARYAKAYQQRFGGPIASDTVLGPSYLTAITGLRELLNGDGAVAMEHGITTDSKDNGYCEALFWDAMEAGGFKEEDLG